MSDPLLDRLVVAVGTEFLVDAEIGRGGMAVVYSATDLGLNRRVAIKVLPPELAFNADVRERFVREAQTSAQLSHPGIVPIYGTQQREGIVYFTMALVDGESLAQRLAREPRLPVAEARRLLAAVADALAYAHSKSVVHRDVKPDNIMLDRTSGQPMVTDFGIARAAQGNTRLTATGVAIGTPAYMSPEQAIGERELDGRSDIYSLAVIGYQLLAGETPFKASNTPGMLLKHVAETPRPIGLLRPDVPNGLAHAITRALAKKPEDRWADASAFRDAILDASEPVHPENTWAQSHSPVRPAAPPAWAPLPTPPLPPRYVDPTRPRDDGRGMAYMEPPRSADMWSTNIPGLPPMPEAPMFGSRDQWRQWKRSRKRWELEHRHQLRISGRDDDRGDVGLTVEEQLTRFRRQSIGTLATVASLAALNIVTSPHFFWFLLPGVPMVIGVLSRAGKLWADGVPARKLFGRGKVAVNSGADLTALPSRARSHEAAQRLVPFDVLQGPFGERVRAAADDHMAVRETFARLPKAEREMIPDVAPTVDALAERVGALATTLHRLDADLADTSQESVDGRIALLKAEMRGEPTPEQERRMAFLERQRVSIGELSVRRSTLASQLESACLALKTLRLDLLKYRSSGLESAMSDVASATQEARALSREIGYAVDAAREVRRL